MSEALKAQYRADILRDYPKLNECPSLVDNLIEAYFLNPEKFKETAKKEQMRERKEGKKQVALVEKPKEVIVEGGIEKIDAENVVVGCRPLPIDESHENEEGIINVSVQ